MTFVQYLKKQDLQVVLGISGILISIVTWTLDLSDLAIHCIYCRTERTVIGLMGIMMLLPVWGSYWTRFFFYPLAFLGAHVAASQIFLHLQHANIWKTTFVFSSAALGIIIGLMIFMWERLIPSPFKEKKHSYKS
jgi:uncharacterized membrane protein